MWTNWFHYHVVSWRFWKQWQGVGEQIISFHLLLGSVQRSCLVRNLKESRGASTQGQGYSVVQVVQPSVTSRVWKCHRHKKYLAFCVLIVYPWDLLKNGKEDPYSCKAKAGGHSMWMARRLREREQERREEMSNARTMRGKRSRKEEKMRNILILLSLFWVYDLGCSVTCCERGRNVRTS